MVSDEFDYSRWQQVFERVPPEQLDVRVRSVSPIGVDNIDEWRRRASLDRDLGPHVPVDKFVFGKGAGPQPHATKINGIPYRPSNRAGQLTRLETG